MPPTTTRPSAPPAGRPTAATAGTARSGLMAKLGAKLQQAHQKHAADDTSFDTGSRLPGGIEGGIAQLVECKFDQYKTGDNVGQYFFYAAGVVAAPKVHDGIPVEGLRTAIMEPLCDTPNRSSRKTVDEHLAWIYNELRKLGLNTSEIGFEELESAVASLKEAKPFFRFRTWMGQATPEFPNPRVNEVWNGQVDYAPDDNETAAAVHDETADVAPPPPPPKVTPKTAAPAKGPAKPAAKQPAPPPVEVEPTLEELAELAGANPPIDGTPEATAKLMELALAAGHAQDTVEQAADWAAVIEMINNPAGAEGEAGEWKPAAGETYGYCPVDPKTKKPAAKAVDCLVTLVDETAQTVGLKNLVNTKITYGKVAWDQLITPE